MVYTQNWNGIFIENTKNIKNLDLCLEIGCFEGLTSNHIINNLLSPNGKLICVDPLTNEYLSENLTEQDEINNKTIYSYFDNQYERFYHNTKDKIDSGKLELYRNLSSQIYDELISKYENSVDFIYIDGDHRADGVYLDAVNCFKLCKNDGIILFDDYLWGDIEGENSTKNGIDRFLKEYEGKYKILINSYQFMIQKK